MFDPHRTRRNDRRFYTKKGQVLQAKNLNAPFTIEQNKINAYKNYLIQNRLAYDAPQAPPPVPIAPIGISGIEIEANKYLFSTFTKSTDPTVNLHYSTGVNQDRVIIYFYKDTDGNHYCEVTYLGRGSTFDRTIENNSECYFLTTGHPYQVTGQDQLDSYAKSILGIPSNYGVFRFYGSQFAISNEVPLQIS